MEKRLAWDVVVLQDHAPGCSKRLPNSGGHLGDHIEQLDQKIAGGGMKTRHVRSRKYETVTEVLRSLPGDGQNEDVGGAVGDELTLNVTGSDETERAVHPLNSRVHGLALPTGYLVGRRSCSRSADPVAQAQHLDPPHLDDV
ncbi:hypothetical protein GCM10023194_51930 [Planotetraspora phitsanulokensis]|uniref:Uncharacterized protein n=1 Tax=Planotetraspora phitsanulokensis TaxID=575192 RepID=A0A8J3UJ96_9ACTN|nr:hypothetical protein Pph01_48280 [Planotetraspora phitsanulokensis]